MYKLSEVYEEGFNSLNDFFKFISEKLITREHDYGFRGHASDAWKLEPTLIRFVDTIEAMYPGSQLDREFMTKLALKRLYDGFKRNLIINSDLPQDRVEKIDLWQYGQHFGLPSPLLDWTHSPYVALFFALSSNAQGGDVSKRCVWVLSLELMERINENVLSEIRPKFKERIKPEEFLNEQFPILEIVQETNENNKRIAFQQGFSTRHGYYRSLDVWLNRIVPELPFTNSDRHALQKLIFPCTEMERVAMLDKLDRMNINNRTLFPDIFGSVKDAVDSTFRSFQAPRYKHYRFSK